MWNIKGGVRSTIICLVIVALGLAVMFGISSCSDDKSEDSQDEKIEVIAEYPAEKKVESPLRMFVNGNDELSKGLSGQLSKIGSFIFTSALELGVLESLKEKPVRLRKYRTIKQNYFESWRLLFKKYKLSYYASAFERAEMEVLASYLQFYQFLILHHANMTFSKDNISFTESYKESNPDIIGQLNVIWNELQSLKKEYIKAENELRIKNKELIASMKNDHERKTGE